jgi:tartrate dehydrogenase/decarboxylase/D-malate dehydrogenase
MNVDTPQETAVQEAWFTRKGTERVIRFAFELARKTGQDNVISATKSNALNYSMVFWDKVFNAVKADYPTISSRTVHVDALAGLFILKPQSLKVVVASNLFGDILTDLGSAMLGSIGISPSANLNPEMKYPSMFEPIHGSAPDIAGKGIANPIGTVWAVVLMLDHLGLRDLSERLMGSMCRVIAARRIRTPDIGGTATTTEVVDAILAGL